MTAGTCIFPTAALLGKLVYNASSITPIYNYGNSGIIRPPLPAGTTHVFAKVWGADAPSSGSSNTVGAVGGYAAGLITLSNTSGSLIVCIGGMGDSYAGSHAGGKNGGGNGGAGYYSGGGGYSAVFNDTGVAYPPLLMMAGGAGGYDQSNGGGIAALPSGSGGTQTTGNSGSGEYIGAGTSSPGAGSGFGSGGGFFGGINGGGGSGHLDTSITHGSLITQTAGTLVKPNSTDGDFITPTQDYPAVTGAYNGEIILYCFSGDPFAAGLLR